MSRHAHGQDHHTVPPQTRGEGEPERRPRNHRHSLPRRAERRDDDWRKHPARSLEADLALLSISRSAYGKR